MLVSSSNRDSKLTKKDKAKIAESFNSLYRHFDSLTREEIEEIKNSKKVIIDGKEIPIKGNTRTTILSIFLNKHSL